MIKRINKISNFGIYKDYSPDPMLQDFSKYNLFYGWNGSGKSTFSKFMQVLSNHVLPEEFVGCEFEIESIDGTMTTVNNLEDFSTKMLVFNQDFINDNINWNAAVKSLLLISEEKIEDRLQLEKLNVDLRNFNKERKDLSNEVEKEVRSVNKFLSETASKIKIQFQKIEINDKYYLNYNKRRIEEFLETNKESLPNPNLSREEIDIFIKSIKPIEKGTLEIFSLNYSEELFSILIKETTELLKTSFATFSIEKLKNNSVISNWVENGLQIHKSHKSEYCEFCGNHIEPERMRQLESHFNEEYIRFKDKIQSMKENINNNQLKPNYYPHTSELYEEFQPIYNQLSFDLNAILLRINLTLINWFNKLTLKTNDPFISINDYEEMNKNDFDELFRLEEEIQNILYQHNEKSKNFETEIARCKKALETHFIFESVDSFKFFAKENEIKRKQNKIKVIEKSLLKCQEGITKIEGTLSDQFLGASEFNKRLHAFLGRKEISLQFDSNLKGYKIIRNKNQAKNLSEGEKTAIAFVYFITKLKEYGNDITSNIIVVDDPISSFDSNNLFHAYSFLKNECQNAKQLFILTHNFNFYKLVRDWLIKKNKVDRDRQPILKSMFYTIETTKDRDDERNSKILNASESLLNYQSEYHYIFSKVYKYKDNQRLTVDEAFIVANLSRKLLESFLSFKYPKKRNDFSQLMDATNCDTVIKDKIYKFINKYSHNQSIEFGDDPVDNLIGESQNVISDILNLINILDKQHYEEMAFIAELTA
jgi:wobble nucleotide-excising tRNase